MVRTGSKKGGLFMTYFVGIDIAKHIHYACVIDQTGQVVTQPFPFENTSVGFQLLLSLLSNYSKDSLFIGFESTAHYHENLAHFLTSNSFTYELINPLLSKRFRGLNIRDVKNDKVDALTIASFLSINRNQPLQEEFFINELAFLSKERDNIVKQRSREYVRLTAYLDRVFPELKPRIKASIKSQGFHNLLSKYSTAKEIKETRIDALYNTLNFKRKSYPKVYISELKDLAKSSVGYHSDVLSKVIKNIIHQIEFLSLQLDEIESEIKSHQLVINSRLNLIPGMGPIQIAYILSAIENITRFDHPSKILAFSGLDPKVRQSGQFTATKTRMSKRGNHLLRYALTWSANNIRNNSSTMNTYYLKKRSEGKSHYNALGHCAKKVVNYIFFILSNPDKDFILE
ncbi:transposase [Breznakia sp. PF5-3]|uniref:IS110 family transposase n=1 Tax=unclassified Breznakia TaxID=2623764 RepID=UPI002404F247|nr:MULTISPECIES: IS110 family transposase [unclassified Breznakia]MDF9823732.1 transposase [Breznakia sp. PM6-1]MDF9834530.1 transposase [Breznakia sp. PF5-3]